MKYLICGGSGFVGQNLTTRLQSAGHEVRIFDKVMPKIGSGVYGDIHDMELLTSSMAGSDVVFHLASNADISVSASDPTVDFHEGTELTQCVLEAMRKSGVHRLVYFSGSGVYGDYPTKCFIEEDYLEPVSTYGASKMASEAMIRAYCAMFGFTAQVFRPANIVGPGQTHGVGLDFIRALKKDPDNLRVLGDGYQTKSYIHINDVMDAVDMTGNDVRLQGLDNFLVFNIASDDQITVREIAILACGVMGAEQVHVDYTGGARGWNGDVPIINLNCSKLRALGWKPALTSAQAIYDAMHAMK